MTPVDLLLRLQKLDVKAWVEGDELRLSQPAESLPDDVRGEIEAQGEALLDFLRAAAGATTEPAAAAIGRAPREGELPLSFAQQRFWFVQQLEQDATAYNLMYVIRLGGELDVAALEWSFQEIVRRHEILRTTFEMSADQPIQVIGEPYDIRLEVMDVSADSDPEARAESLAVEEMNQRFDAHRLPLFRVRLIRTGAHQHRLLITMLHIISDGWSYGVLFSELTQLYRARLAGQASPLADLPIQYADYAHWQRAQYESQAAGLSSYWTKQLEGVATLELPTDRPRPPQQTFQGTRRFFTIPDQVDERLKKLGVQEGCTHFMTMLAAFDVLLARWSGQDDIVVGTPVANRDRPELESLIGPFLNTLVLRSDLSGNPSFRELMGRVRETSLQGQQYRDMPFEQLVIDLQPARDLSRNPLFQVVFNILYETDPPQLGPLETQLLQPEVVTSQVDLSLILGKRGGAFEFNTALFDGATIERMEQHFQVLLAELSANPDARIFDVSVLTEAEKKLTLVDKNQTARDYPRDRTFPQLFEEQVGRAPDAMAVTCGSDSLTYAELNARANKMARHLRSRGAGPDVLIGLNLERSLDMLVALLAIQKSGAAYVPLDPTYPAERIAFIVEDAGIELMIAIEGTVPGTVPSIVRLDRDAEAIAAQSAENLEPVSGPENLAYVIFTSGSTGKPKGVQIEHRALVNFLSAMAERPGLTADDVLVAVTTISFDIAGLELYLPLLVGARIELATDEVASDGRQLAALLDKATIMQATPATWRLLLEVDWNGADRVVALCGGEALPRELAEQLLPRCKALWNMYGPTETTIWSLVARVTSGEGAVGIGEPIANTRIYLLDRHLHPVPIGVPGKLFLGGDGLARGYWVRDQLTAEKFIANPLPGGQGRLYDTGDMARYRADGSLEFLGRVDNQVKIRGYRIELGEIESVLNRHEAVADSAVVVQTAGADTRLVAHVVFESGKSAEVATLRETLRQRLPDYMVPAAFVTHDTFPLTPNGKVDRKALARTQQVQTAVAKYVAPRTASEQLIAETWCEILGVERAGLLDNFFDLGGHSLLAMKTIFRLEKAIGARIAPMELLVRNLEQFAAVCDQLASSGEAPAQPIERVSRDGNLPPSFAQQRFWFLSQLESEKSAYNVPLALHLHGPLDLDALTWSLNEIIRRHESLRTSFGQFEGEPVLVIAETAEANLEVLDLAGDPEAERKTRERAQADAEEAFDLSTGPVYRFTLLRQGEQHHLLLATFQHVTVDQWSQGLFCRELSTLYGTRVNGQPSPLPELPIQYADYASWQRKWYETEGPEHLAYWVRKLEHLPTLTLPTDRPRPEVQTFVGATRAFEIPDHLAAGIRALGRHERSTFFMTMLAAFKVLLARHCGLEDIVVGTPVASRGSAEAESLIGLFLNTLVLRSDLSGDPTFRELVTRVRDTSLEAFAHQGVPFEQLVQEVRPERDLSRNPLFQVLFQLNDTYSKLTLGPVEVEPYQLDHVSAKFDLTLAATDSPEGASGIFEYNVDLFDEATIARMEQHFLRLLENIVADPDRCIWELAILPEPERVHVMEALNQTARDYPRELTFPQLFETQVERSPDATAVTCGDESLTYAELNARANKMARHLRSLGAGPDVLIGLGLERSLDMLVALLAIQKSGAAYVPLDPTYPAERIAFIVEDAGIELMIAIEGTVPGTVPSIVRLDRDAEAIAAQSAENLEPVSGPDNLAYVIFTSGSTGKPKGVQIEHRALVNFLAAMAERPGLTAEDVLVAVTTISFDIAGLELYLPLLVGARIVLATDEVASDGRELATALTDATIMQATPATWRLLLEAGWKGNDRLKILCGGEALPRELAEQLLPRCAELWNMYGPTETTIWSLVERVTSGEGQVSIGKPIANTTIYLLDPHRKPVPIGVPGELYLGGDGLARGYWNRPELTAEKFVDHPFSDNGHARLYNTGDLACHRLDGQIEFLGRVDHQVKVRGFRIELGEIEHTLAQHEAVKECAVVAQTKRSGDQYLVAHTVLHPGVSATVSELRRHVRESLPDYMVPPSFVMIDELPLTPNGKIDRKALMGADKSQTEAAEQYMPPVTEMERFLAEIWAEILEIEKVGLNDNFFDLGGHSLLAMRVAFKVEKKFGYRVLPMEMLIQNLSAFAQMCEKRRTVKTPPAADDKDKPRGMLGRLKRRLGRTK